MSLMEKFYKISDFLETKKANEVNDHPRSGWLDRYASLQPPPFKAGLREAIWNRYIPFREAPPFKAGSFNFPAYQRRGKAKTHLCF
jgi:hypothetical protein